jgi:hypothetical protein
MAVVRVGVALAPPAVAVAVAVGVAPPPRLPLVKMRAAGPVEAVIWLF